MSIRSILPTSDYFPSFKDPICKQVNSKDLKAPIYVAFNIIARVANFPFIVIRWVFTLVIDIYNHFFTPALTLDLKIEKQWSSIVTDQIKPYFLAPYQNGSPLDKVSRIINRQIYTVERFNHGLAMESDREPWQKIFLVSYFK